MENKNNNRLLSGIFFTASLLSLIAIFSINIDIGSVGFILIGAIIILVAVLMAGSTTPAWGVILGLICLGGYCVARGAGYLSHAYLRYAVIILLLSLIGLYGLSFIRSFTSK